MCSLEIFVTVKFNNIEIQKNTLRYMCLQYVTNNIVIALILKHELTVSLNLSQKLRAYFDKK